MKKAFTLLELVIYILFIAIIGFVSFNVVNQFFGLNNSLKQYKNMKLDFLKFEKDFINLLTLDYVFFTGGNKLVLSGDIGYVGYFCSGTLQKAIFDSGGNILNISYDYENLFCNSLSGYFYSGLNLDLDLKFRGTGLVLHYYFK